MTWTGEERRGNPEDTGVRLALLEQSQKQFKEDTEKRHTENHESLIAVHKRITGVDDRIAQLGQDFDDALSRGLDAIMDKLDKQDELYQARSERITKIEAAQIWIERSLYGLGSVGVLIAGWIFHHGTQAK